MLSLHWCLSNHFDFPLIALVVQQPLRQRSVLSLRCLWEGYRGESSGGGGRWTGGRAKSCRLVLKGSSRLGGITLPHHVMPSLLLLLPALLKGRGVGLLTYLYSHPLCRKRNKPLSQSGMLWERGRRERSRSVTRPLLSLRGFLIEHQLTWSWLNSSGLCHSNLCCQLLTLCSHRYNCLVFGYFEFYLFIVHLSYCLPHRTAQ